MTVVFLLAASYVFFCTSRFDAEWFDDSDLVDHLRLIKFPVSILLLTLFNKQRVKPIHILEGLTLQFGKLVQFAAVIKNQKQMKRL